MDDQSSGDTHGSGYDVAIIGAGFSGIGMAHKLRAAGIEDIIVLERALGVGGTWRDNVYPGCACDIPSHLYSFSFRQNADWSRLYPSQQEIRRYLEDCVDDFGLNDKLRCGSAVERATFDEGTGRWTIRLADGSSITAAALVSAIGGLSRPSIPPIPGLEDFNGDVFHTAAWRQDCDLRGRRVAVVGTGASAIQLVPRIAPEVDALRIFQRTPPWIVAKPDRPIRPWERWLLRHLPPARWLFRHFLYWRQEVLGAGFTVSRRLMGHGRRMALEHIESGIRDPELRRKVTPDYEIGCKRILLSDDYYPTLERDNVELVAAGVERFTPRGVVDASGQLHEVDTVIFATGFNAIDPLSPTRIFGSGGQELAEVWQEAPEAYLGISVSGFPNLFLLMGPNTGLGHNSVIFMIEAQIRYSVALIRRILARKGTVVDVRADVQADYNKALKRAFRGTVWASGCQSWYQSASGRQVAIWPGFTFTYWFRTLRPKLSRYTRATPRPSAS